MNETNCMILTSEKAHQLTTGSKAGTELRPIELKSGECVIPVRSAFDANHHPHHPLMATLSARMVRDDEFTWYEEEE